MRSPRHVITALAMLATGTVVGVAVQQSVSADVSSGDRPVLIQITPCRLADTRPAPNNVGPRLGKLGPAETVTFDVQEASTKCAGLIPTDAVGLSMNVTALNASSKSFFTIWPGGPRPLASSLNPAPGEPPTPNAVATPTAGGEFSVYNNRGNTDILIDINGYYVNHDHDDLYGAGGATTAGTVSIGTADFHPTVDKPPFVKSLDVGTGNGGAWFLTDPHAGVVGFAAPVQLPEGSTITDVTAHFSDTSAITALNFQLRCAEHDGGVFVVAQGDTTTGAAAGQKALTVDPNRSVVDNGRCSYFFIAESGSWLSETDKLKIRGATITTT